VRRGKDQNYIGGKNCSAIRGRGSGAFELVPEDRSDGLLAAAAATRPATHSSTASNVREWRSNDINFFYFAQSCTHLGLIIAALWLRDMKVCCKMRQ